MALTKVQATAITEAVAADADSKRYIQSWLRALPDSWGMAGPIRNFGFAIAITYTPGPDDKYDHLVCTSISAAASKAINKAGLSAVRTSGTVDRFHPYPHTATQVDMKDGSIYVFDWWLTLNVNNPAIFPSVAQWKAKMGAVTLAGFGGFS